MTYRIRSYLQGGQPLDINAWILNEDGSIFETDDPSEAEKMAADYNSEQKGKKGSKRLRYEIVKFNKQRGIPELGQGQN